MTTWLSYDLDYATGDCRDGGWDMSQCAWRCEGCSGMGMGRAQGLPRDRVKMHLATFGEYLKKLHLLPPVIVRDCHAEIIPFLQENDRVISWDFHWDAYDTPDPGLHCANWIIYAEELGVYVQGEDWHMGLDDGPMRLFIAVSRPYTSSVCDGVLFAILMDLELPVDLFGGDGRTMRHSTPEA